MRLSSANSSSDSEYRELRSCEKPKQPHKDEAPQNARMSVMKKSARSKMGTCWMMQIMRNGRAKSPNTSTRATVLQNQGSLFRKSALTSTMARRIGPMNWRQKSLKKMRNSGKSRPVMRCSSAR